MSTMHIRARRFLSANRRTGLQCDPHAARGVAGRHAQGWRDNLQQPEDDGLSVARQIAECVAMAGIVWGCIAACVWILAVVL